MIELISSEEKQCMSDYIANESFTLPNSKYTHTNPASIDYILRVWEEQKSQYLFKLFGGELILRKENFILEKPIAILRQDYFSNIRWKPAGTDFISKYIEYFYELYRSKIINFDNYDELTNLIEARNDYLFTNKYNGPTFTIPLGDKDFRITNGAKTSKLLKQIAELIGLSKPYEAFRIAHSQLLNDKKLTGTLCLSIHPLDYITMSDNDCDWDSCMRWTKENEGLGEYRAGTIEMMNSPCAIVAYLESATPMERYDLKWNNKKWRELFIVDKSCLVNILGYPYELPEVEKAILTWLKDLAAENLGWEYLPSLYQGNNGNKINIEDREVTFSFCTNFMYNDFDSGHYLYISPESLEYNYIVYSGPFQCMYCGEITDNISENNQLVCNECEVLSICEYCECVVGEDNLITTNTGMVLCQDCYESYINSCEKCGNEHFESNLRLVYFALKPGDILKTDLCLELCPDCRDKYEVEIYHDTNNWYMVRHVALVTEEQLKELGFSLEEYYLKLF